MKNLTPVLLRTFLFAAFLLIATGAKAQSAGSLDSTFGTGGIVETYLSDAATLKDTVVQPDGKIIVVGLITVPAPQPGQPANGGPAFVARFNSNGSLDTTFDGDGYNNSFNFADARAVALQDDGKIVVAGYAQNTSNRAAFAVARFNTDGSLDSTFNVSGKVITTVGLDAAANSVSIQPDGKIVAAGTTALTSVFSNRDFAVVRYYTDGSLDATFGSGGRVATDFNNGTDEIYDTAVQTDGKIVAVGFSTDTLSNTKSATLVRYNSDGSLDSSFGSGGKTIKSGAVDSSAAEVAIQADGKIIIVGEGNFPLRYNQNGMLETTFQSAGNNFVALSAAIQANGKIVVGGAELITGNPTGVAVVRYNSDGALDSAFGTGGKVITTFPNGAYSSSSGAVAVAIQPDGNIVAGGTTVHNGSFQIFMARYLGELLPKPKSRKRVRFF